jgi:hypothetical protein
MVRQLIAGRGRLLSHVELVYRPGERRIVAAFFELLGCAVVDPGREFLVVHVDPENRDPRMLDNCLYASEATPEQLRFEEALATALREEGALRSAHLALGARNTVAPQRTTHFGIRVASLEALDEIVARLRSAPPTELAGRVEVAGVVRPGDPGSLSPMLAQAFVRTDSCAAGFVSLGQHVELQAAVRPERSMEEA